ncbi:hypothetical protein MT418_001840 [Batrachochytrium dendrobatidis]
MKNTLWNERLFPIAILVHLLLMFSSVAAQWIQTVTVNQCKNEAFRFTADSLEMDVIMPATAIGAPPNCIQITPTVNMYYQFTPTGTVKIYQCSAATCASTSCTILTELQDIAKMPTPDCGNYFHTLSMSKPFTPDVLAAVMVRPGVGTLASAYYTSMDMTKQGASTAGCQGTYTSGAIHYIFEDCVRGNATHWIKTQFTPSGQQTFANRFCASNTCTANCASLDSYSKPAPLNQPSCAVGNSVDTMNYPAVPTKANSEYQSKHPIDVWPYTPSIVNTTVPTVSADSPKPSQSQSIEPTFPSSPNSNVNEPTNKTALGSGSSSYDGGKLIDAGAAAVIATGVFLAMSGIAFGAIYILIKNKVKERQRHYQNQCMPLDIEMTRGNHSKTLFNKGAQNNKRFSDASFQAALLEPSTLNRVGSISTPTHPMHPFAPLYPGPSSTLSDQRLEKLNHSIPAPANQSEHIYSYAAHASRNGSNLSYTDFSSQTSNGDADSVPVRLKRSDKRPKLLREAFSGSSTPPPQAPFLTEPVLDLKNSLAQTSIDDPHNSQPSNDASYHSEPSRTHVATTSEMKPASHSENTIDYYSTEPAFITQEMHFDSSKQRHFSMQFSETSDNQ